MILLEIDSDSLTFLFVLIGLFWGIPIIMLILGLIRLKSRPKSAKVLLIIAGVWLLCGLGFCGSMMR